ncbi:MAG: UDP-3-O-(3-hydroxymyristoyl)glucosamine N-acyltransferase [Gammaproteobacteria bacterium]|nr:UDP-3-O-(3-hydroxymyristoyl)glucosamine N-acyltransferase [Gammaproteobacteria bacterium]MCW8909718.1 UDP-3-O-(3-hydroxymyristoyl)glucosamine N-acyltransferase [Gammaproteobacteria bacterium]MCW9004767.1 UDP-3-O-(3-hydroxymyristoyl)glucosamine N-acyltransferase [Gammaproteobacteria bacterium]MCW9055040.1 UDP-3-O-(3-hydroxymyristoyl)glucosamine N-acyltransferase [Gammaproteobacteria bacterium]
MSSYTLAELAEKVGGKVAGNGDCVITSVASIENATAGSICFIYSSKFAKYLADTKAEAVILTAELAAEAKVPALIVDKPRAAYAHITALLYPQYKPEPGIHSSAVIDDSAQIADSAYIGANVVIEAGVRIGDGVYIGPGCIIGRKSELAADVYLHANVTVYYGCSIGENSIIHSASVIGADGFGFEHDGQEWVKIHQVGGVCIGKNVEIGACSTVDRGAVSDTIIEDGVKLDNHIQIAHGVKVGENTIMSNGVGVAGSTIIGKNCMIGGMTGIKDNIEITDNVIITAMSLVSKPLTKPGSYSSNTPIDDTRTWRKNTARFRQLDEIARRVMQLEKTNKKD